MYKRVIFITDSGTIRCRWFTQHWQLGATHYFLRKDYTIFTITDYYITDIKEF